MCFGVLPMTCGMAWISPTGTFTPRCTSTSPPGCSDIYLASTSPFPIVSTKFLFLYKISWPCGQQPSTRGSAKGPGPQAQIPMTVLADCPLSCHQLPSSALIWEATASSTDELMWPAQDGPAHFLIKASLLKLCQELNQNQEVMGHRGKKSC